MGLNYKNDLKIPHFFLLFLTIYLISHKVFKNWGPKIKYEACSCFISLFHGTPSVILSLYAIYPIIIQLNIQNPKTPSIFGTKNTPFQNLAIDFSCGYFIMDLLHYLIFIPNDVLFIAHHLATLFVLTTCRFLVMHGAFEILVILIIAEVTSFCQNLWYLARLRKDELGFAKKVYDFLVPEFYVFYSVCRGVLVPLFVIKMGVVYVSGGVDDVIPRWVWCCWIVMTVFGDVASLLWILNLWVVFFKDMRECKKLN